VVHGVQRRLELPLDRLEGGPKGDGCLLRELQLAFQQCDALPHVIRLRLELHGWVSPGRGIALDSHQRNGRCGRARTSVWSCEHPNAGHAKGTNPAPHPCIITHGC
jgi:hypothetical protein